jgi:GT2 family glycosyltransferase
MDHQPFFVSIVLLNYNGRKFVELWDSLFSLDYSSYEIIFIDNGSHDGSGTEFIKLAKQHPNQMVKMLKLTQNCGYSMANNLGVEKAEGELIVLLSNDIKVTKDWLKNAVSVFESDERIGIAQSALYLLDFPSQLDRTGNYVDVFGFNHSSSLSDNAIGEVFYSEGAAMFIRREVINETSGLFDEKYFMLYEDVDFCWRARLMGYKVVVMPTSKAYHKCGGTVPGTLMKTDPQYVFTNTRNRLNTLVKNYSIGNCMKFVPLSAVLETIKGIWLMSDGKEASGLAVFSGIFSFLSGIHDTIKKRARVQGKRRLKNDREIMRLMTPLNEAIRNTIRNVRRLHGEPENDKLNITK